jgi:threonine/homoserine/homoserine lactone efflux protein
MTYQDQDRDPWEEFDNLKPAGPDRVEGYPGGEPVGFGFRTGVRSAKVAVGFAVYALVLGTTLVLTGVVVFIAQREWLLLGLMAAIEAVFIYAFIRLVRQARHRRPSS